MTHWLCLLYEGRFRYWGKQHLSHSMRKTEKNHMCAQGRLKSARASAQPHQSLRCVFNGKLMINGFFMRTVKTMIGLGGQVILLVLSCSGSFNKRCRLQLYPWNEPQHDKTNKMTVRPAKTQISLGIRPVYIFMYTLFYEGDALSYSS